MLLSDVETSTVQTNIPMLQSLGVVRLAHAPLFEIRVADVLLDSWMQPLQVGVDLLVGLGLQERLVLDVLFHARAPSGHVYLLGGGFLR